VDRKQFWKCLKVSFRNECLSYLMVYFMYPYMVSNKISFTSPLPAIWKCLLQLYICNLAAEIIFYYSHRSFHHPLIYKHIHKMHHEWIAPISIAASYAHPIEHIICNAFPVIVPPVFLGMHISIMWYWFAVAQYVTVLHHCNYHLPFLVSPQFHDYHHLKFTECFGTNGLLDSFHKTDINFQNSVQSKRHKTFYSLKPICQQYPSKNPKEN